MNFKFVTQSGGLEAVIFYGGCVKNDALLHRLDRINIQQNKLYIYDGRQGMEIHLED